MTSARKKIASKAAAIGFVLKRGDTDDAGYALFAAAREVDPEDKEVDVDVEEEVDEDENADDGSVVRLVEESPGAAARAAARATARNPLDEPEEAVFGRGFAASLEEVDAFLDKQAALVGANVAPKDRPPVAPPSVAKLHKAIGDHEHADEIKRLIKPRGPGRPKKETEAAPPESKPTHQDDGFGDEPIVFPGSRNPPPIEASYNPTPKAARIPVVAKEATARRPRLDVGAVRSASDKLNLASEIGALYRRGRAADLTEAGRLLKRKQDQLGHGGWLPWLTKNETVLGFGRMTAHRLIKRALDE